MTSNQAAPAKRNLLLRVLLGLLVLVVVVVGGLYAGEAWQTHARAKQYAALVKPSETLKTYNFTPYRLKYVLNERYSETLTPNVATGAGTLLFAFQFESDKDPLRLSWSYVAPDGSAEPDSPKYEAILPQPVRPAGRAVLTLRFYPEGRVAARFTETPEIGDFDNVSPELTGEGWVTKP